MGGTTNPSIHYLGVVGETTLYGDHTRCEAQWERIKTERSSEYGADGAYNFGMCNSHAIRMEGRGWNRDSAANGGENGVWYNEGSRALCVLVGTEDVITDACKRGVADFAVEATTEHGMNWPLRPHSFYVATSCPGDNLRVVIDEVNAGKWRDDEPAPTPKRKVNRSMWIALLLDSDYCDVYYNGVVVDGFTNDQKNAVGVGPRLQGYLDQGAGLTSFKDGAAYAPTRDRLAKAAS